MAETAEVSALLAAVFDDEPEIVDDPATEDRDDESVAGLDGPHSRLARTLVTRSRWTTAEVAARAQAQGLLMAGALDTINEAFIDAVGAVLCNIDGEHIVIDDYAVEGLDR